MNIVDPRIPTVLLPAESHAQIVNSVDRAYRDLPSVITPLSVITRWEPTPEERAAILRGEDIYVTILAPNHSIHPFYLSVGPVDWTEEHL